MKKMILIGVMIFLVSIIPVHANLTVRYNKTTNTLGNAVWNETFAASGNKTFWITLPKNSSVIDAKLNLSGYESIGSLTLNETNGGNVGDSEVYLNQPTTNMGSTQYIDIWSHPLNYARGFLLWNLSVLPISVTITKANMSLYMRFINKPNKIYNIYNTSNSWTETDITWNNQPSAGNFQSQTNISSTENIRIYWNIINATIHQFSQGNKNLSVLIKDSAEGDSDTAANIFYSKEGSYKPQLVIDYSFGNITNPYLDVEGDGDTEWSFSGSFNQTNNQTSDFSKEINSYLKNCYPYPDGTCNVPFILHSDSAGILRIWLNNTITYDTEIYDKEVYEGQPSQFWIKVNSTSDIQNVNAWLVWNETSYAYTTKQQNGSYWIFTKDMIIPSVNNNINISFYWNFTYTNATGTYPQNFSSKNQTVYTLKLFNCTSGNITLNFTGHDEETSVLMNYSMDATFNYWVSGKTFTKNFSYEYRNNNTYFVCIQPSDVIIYADATIRYWSTNFSDRYHYLVNATLTNNMQDIDLYLFNETNQITFTVQNEVSLGQSNVIIKAQRWFIGTDNYLLVAEGKTSNDGTAYINLKPNDWYKYILEQNGVVQREFETQYLNTTTVNLPISSLELPSYFDYWNTVAYSCSYSNSTNILTCTYSDTSGKSVNMCLQVEQYNMTGKNVTCTECSTSSSSTLVCTLSAGNNTYKANLYSSFCCSETSWNIIWQQWIQTAGTVISRFGLTGVLIAFLLIMLMFFIGLWNYGASIVLGMFGLVMSYAFGLLNTTQTTITTLIGLIVIAAIIIYEMKT